jgi:multimeric flavodoxin WrbA
MKTVGFVGSPRVGGNTDILVSEILRGAAEAGAETDKVLLNQLDIAPCQACETCRRTKRCRLDDDMQALYETMLSADVLVLGTPIYYWGPSAQLKTFVDRWYAIDQEGLREGLAGKTVQLVCAFADSDLQTARYAIGMLETSVRWLQMQWREPLLGVAWKRGEIRENQALLGQAYNIGRDLASRR